MKSFKALAKFQFKKTLFLAIKNCNKIPPTPISGDYDEEDEDNKETERPKDEPENNLISEEEEDYYDNESADET